MDIHTVPKRLISDPALDLPLGIALDQVHNEILVANSNFPNPDTGSSSILVFRRTDAGFVLDRLLQRRFDETLQSSWCRDRLPSGRNDRREFKLRLWFSPAERHDL
jgi:hypothetical protein